MGLFKPFHTETRNHFTQSKGSSLFPFCFLLSPFLVPLFVGHCVRLVSLLSSFVAGLVSFFVGHRVRLVSLLSLFVSLLVGHCVRLVSLLVGDCVRLVSLLAALVASSSPL